MTASERIEFANKAVSTGDLSLKKAGTIMSINDLKRVDTESGVEVRHIKQTADRKYDVIKELENSIAFQKQYGDQKGIEIKEGALAKLRHLHEGEKNIHHSVILLSFGEFSVMAEPNLFNSSLVPLLKINQSKTLLIRSNKTC